MDDNPFAALHRMGRPPWDIGRAQPAFVELANEGLVTGSVLEVGCGTGDNTIEMAERGNPATGVDLVPQSIDAARAKATDLGVDATFLVGDALEVSCLGANYDTVLDCGLFHTFSNGERLVYEQQLRGVLRPGGRLHILCFSDKEDAAWGGPRRVSQWNLMDTFRRGWRVDDIREARLLTVPSFRIKGHAWIATMVRERQDTKPGPKPLVRRRKESVSSAADGKGRSAA